MTSENTQAVDVSQIFLFDVVMSHQNQIDMRCKFKPNFERTQKLTKISPLEKCLQYL